MALTPGADATGLTRLLLTGLYLDKTSYQFSFLGRKQEIPLLLGTVMVAFADGAALVGGQHRGAVFLFREGVMVAAEDGAEVVAGKSL